MPAFKDSLPNHGPVNCNVAIKLNGGVPPETCPRCTKTNGGPGKSIVENARGCLFYEATGDATVYAKPEFQRGQPDLAKMNPGDLAAKISVEKYPEPEVTRAIDALAGSNFSRVQIAKLCDIVEVVAGGSARLTESEIREIVAQIEEAIDGDD